MKIEQKGDFLSVRDGKSLLRISAITEVHYYPGEKIDIYVGREITKVVCDDEAQSKFRYGKIQAILLGDAT